MFFARKSGIYFWEKNIMKKIFILTSVLLFVCINTFGQTKVTVAEAQEQMDSILLGQRQLPSMLIVGSFHFAYYNFDAHKTDETEQVNVLSPERQKEMEALVEYIKLYKPTKIAVESGPITGYLLRRYDEWQAGIKPLGADEIEQIGFRLMHDLNLDTIYGVNARPIVMDWYDSEDSLCLRPILDSVYNEWDFISDDTISNLYKQFYDFDDALALKMSLLDYFLYLNSDRVLNKGYGSYLTGDFNLGTYEGADALAMHWYSRNLRIFRNLQEITTSPNDRVLLIIGQGHAQILTHLFECSNEFNLVKFGAIGQE